MPAVENLKLTYAEYAKREQESGTKSEFLNGEVFAMAGGTEEHATLGARMIAALARGLEGTPCEPKSSDLRIRTPSGLGAYPDVSVVCGKSVKSSEDGLSVTNPTLIVEVLSEGTEAYDRGIKFAHYRSMASLKEYVLVSFREPAIESHIRNDDGTWTETFARAGETLTLRSVDLPVDVDTLFRGMTHDTAEGRMVLT